MQLDLSLPPAFPVAVTHLAPEQPFEQKVEGAVATIKRQILAGRRLVVACSFGKDSSVTLSLALTAMRELRDAGAAVPELHVMNSDTLLENPVVHAYTRQEIRALEAYAAAQGLPVRVWVSSPSLSNNYLVSMIGGRTIASMPDNSAKCQQSLKAAPLGRTKRKIRALVKAELGAAFKESDLVTLVGTRVDESVVRGRNMAKRGESAAEPVNIPASNGQENWVLSPIADFTTMDVFEYLGSVTSGLIETYSDFQALTEVYRDSAGGECMVNLFAAGRQQGRTACGARHGCWVCTRVQSDKSMEHLLAEESGKYAWMKPLNDYRNFIQARHYDPAARNWLSRTVDPATGKIKISPNAYSPAFTLELLRCALSIDADEAAWSMRNQSEMRFRLLTLQDIVAIDVLWGRYGYQEPFTALKQYKTIYEEGRRYRVPTDAPMHDRNLIANHQVIELPFADEHFDGLFEGLRSISHATGNCESLVEKVGMLYEDVRAGDEFEVDEEGAELFFTFEMDHALERYGPYTGVAPSAAVHHLMGLGTVQINRGGHSEWDRMLRVGNQIHRHGLREVLHDPQALASALESRARRESLELA